MKKLGLVGGLAWISTAEYYSQLYRSIEKGLNGAHALGRPTSFEMSIESLDLQTALSLTGKENDERSWSRFDAYHRDALLRLQKSGVACAAIASNTPHIRYDSIIQGIEVPVIDMFTAVAEEVASRGAKQALILGTPLTMKSDRFKRILSSHGIHAVPVTNEQTISDVFKLIGRLQAGRVQGCAETLDMIVRRLWTVPRDARPHVVLSCTELPLAFPERSADRPFLSGDIVYIDSMAVHIRAILKRLLSYEHRGTHDPE